MNEDWQQKGRFSNMEEQIGKKAPSVRLLRSDEYAQAGEVLGRAFRDDPQWTATISDPASVPELLNRMFTAVARSTVAAGGPAEATSRMEAVALWLPPGRDIGFWAMMKSGFALIRFGMRMPAGDRARMTGVLRQLDEEKKDLAIENDWHLVAIGVDPNSQGKGFGSALLGSGIRRADAGNEPIYLETDTERNVTFYQRFGFEVLEQITADAVGVPMWLMLREPSASVR